MEVDEEGREGEGPDGGEEDGKEKEEEEDLPDDLNLDNADDVGGHARIKCWAFCGFRVWSIETFMTPPHQSGEAFRHESYPSCRTPIRVNPNFVGWRVIDS